MHSNIGADAIVLVGHGTRHKMGQQQFLALTQHFRAAVAPLPVEVAYIELQTPSVQESLISLHQRGLKLVILSPALLFAAGHAKQDIPAAVNIARQKCPNLSLKLVEPLGCHEALLELAAQRFFNAVSSVVLEAGSTSCSLSLVLRGESQGEASVSPITSDSALVLVGRGSSDPAAIAHCQEFATKLAARVGVPCFFTGFLAVAEPNLPAALDLAAASGAKRVIVQPHLLFAGEMLETTTAAVQVARCKHPFISWLQAETLGSDLLLADSGAARYLTAALLSRIRE